MGGRGGGSPATRRVDQGGPPETEVSFSQSGIRSIYDDLAPSRGDWVNIADIRDAFPEVSRERMDDMLRTLEQRSDVNVVPQADERNLSKRTRDAAIRIGGQAKHFIAMGI